MALSNIIRGVGHRITSVGRAVQAASQKLDQTVAGTPPQVPVQPAAPTAAAPSPAPAAAQAPSEGASTAPKGFQLPDLGSGPDANAQEYQGEGGKKKLEMDTADFRHKQDIHQAFSDLDKIYSEAHPGRDFEKEYRDSVAAQQQHEAERPRGSGLARAALALGDMNPAVQQSGRSNLADYNARVDEAAQQSDKSFSQRMMLKMRAHEAAASDAESQGNWKKALAENEKLALLKADESSLEHRRKMEEIGAQQAGATKRAGIRADAMERTARTRANSIGAAHDLSGTFLQTFEKEAAKAVAKLLGPRDLTKEYDPADLDSITTYLEHLAEMFHDQQYGSSDGGAARFKLPPGQRPSAKSATKEQF